eukprot:TRINITY_DN58758_c0_g1_i1.p1 TRINITY_DN58758_c0_g1~~TRINITY_DN58758_c0_g1_i1.p1  ORF type:complete len:347 (+),score=47.79 TRINITY_DN58758_c0_g1_i1:84-1124(+)
MVACAGYMRQRWLSWFGLAAVLVIVGGRIREGNGHALDHYQVLGISHSATLREVQRAYRRAALLEHPDKSSRPDSEDRFRRVAEAFEVLGNPELRSLYDEGKLFQHDAVGDEWQRPFSSVDPYQLFRDQVGDVYQHWQPGYRVEGDILRNHERIRIHLHPDGSSDVRESEDSGMHRFRTFGAGWCLFDYDPPMMFQEGMGELECRQKCVEMHPSCEGYAFEQGSGACEVYKREDPPSPVAATDGTPKVVCYQQDDGAFDVDSSAFKSVITITKPDGTQSGFTRVMFCHTQQRQKHALEHANAASTLREAEQAAASILDSWSSALVGMVRQLLGRSQAGAQTAAADL